MHYDRDGYVSGFILKKPLSNEPYILEMRTEAEFLNLEIKHNV